MMMNLPSILSELSAPHRYQGCCDIYGGTPRDAGSSTYLPIMRNTGKIGLVNKGERSYEKQRKKLKGGIIWRGERGAQKSARRQESNKNGGIIWKKPKKIAK